MELSQPQERFALNLILRSSSLLPLFFLGCLPFNFFQVVFHLSFGSRLPFFFEVISIFLRLSSIFFQVIFHFFCGRLLFFIFLRSSSIFIFLRSSSIYLGLDEFTRKCSCPKDILFLENSNRTQKWFLLFYLLLFIMNIKPPRHRFGFSLAWGWQFKFPT